MSQPTKKPRQVVGYASSSVITEFLDRPEARIANKSYLTPDQTELAIIRQELGLKIEKYAQALGIKRERLLSYLHGKANVSHDVLADARELKALKRAPELHSQRIGRRFEAWRQRLSLTKSEDVKLAKLFGMTIQELEAIESGRQIVSKHQIAAFENMVERIEAFLP